MSAYYNEIDLKAAAWLRELIAQGHLPGGEVDTRSIEDVQPDDLRPFTQHHFFAGVGGWPLALAMAGWPDNRPVWTGSCPCQPFSAAGKGKGLADKRHLWPAWHWLIDQRQPAIIFGEQVASPDGLRWLDLVSSDLEASGYAVGAADICAAGVGAPHLRNRLWFVADADAATRGQSPDGTAICDRQAAQRAKGAGGNGERSAVCGLADTIGSGSQRGLSGRQDARRQVGGECDGPDGAAGGVGNTDGIGRAPGGEPAQGARYGHPSDAAGGDAGNFWADVEWLPFKDAKWRPVEPGSFPLGDGIPARMVRVRGYGNAIVPQAGAEFIKATGLI